MFAVGERRHWVGLLAVVRKGLERMAMVAEREMLKKSEGKGQKKRGLWRSLAKAYLLSIPEGRGKSKRPENVLIVILFSPCLVGYQQRSRQRIKVSMEPVRGKRV